MTVYNAQDLTPEFIITQFLYGSSTPPADLASESLIRPTNSVPAPIQVDMASYFASAGRFAAPIELQRFDADVIAAKPDLVIWQVGTNAVWQSPDQNPPSFDETTRAICEGLVKLRDRTQADVILMDLQCVPAVLTPAKKDKAMAMVEAIGELARDGVNVFRRFAFMQGLHEVEQVSFDRMVAPEDEHRLHDSNWVTNRVAWAMKLAIVGGVDKARSPVAVPSPPSPQFRCSVAAIA